MAIQIIPALQFPLGHLKTETQVPNAEGLPLTEPFRPSQHFLPAYHHWGDVSSRVEAAIKVPIRRVPHVPQWTGDPPFLVYSCGWMHLNRQGALTEEKFQADLAGAIIDFTNDINSHAEFIAYPITHVPPETEGKAFHDWIGAAYPFDLRAIIMYDENIQIGQPGASDYDMDAGLKFFLNTLISPEMTKNVGVNP